MRRAWLVCQVRSVNTWMSSLECVELPLKTSGAGASSVVGMSGAVSERHPQTRIGFRERLCGCQRSNRGKHIRMFCMSVYRSGRFIAVDVAKAPHTWLCRYAWSCGIPWGGGEGETGRGTLVRQRSHSGAFRPLVAEVACPSQGRSFSPIVSNRKRACVASRRQQPANSPTSSRSLASCPLRQVR